MDVNVCSNFSKAKLLTFTINVFRIKFQTSKVRRSFANDFTEAGFLILLFYLS